jgi:hypothetical protein
MRRGSPGQEPRWALRRALNLARLRMTGRVAELFVIGNDDLSERLRAPQHDVATLAALFLEPQPLERTNALSAGDPRQPAHTSTSLASKCSSGTGRPSASKAET